MTGAPVDLMTFLRAHGFVAVPLHVNAVGHARAAGPGRWVDLPIRDP